MDHSTEFTLEQMRTGFMLHLQNENQCKTTGATCGEKDKCDCWLEMEAWCREGCPEEDGTPS